MILDATIVLAYVAILIWLSLRGGTRVDDGDGFAAADGNYGTFVIFATLSASYVGGGYSSGNAAQAFENGIGTTVALLGFSLSMLAVGKWLAPKVGQFTGAYTVGGIMRQTYGTAAGKLTGVFSFLCCAGVVGAQMETMGTVFHSLLGLPPALGILLGGGVVLLYSTFGGLRSVIVADVLQFLLLAVGMPLLLIGALRTLDTPLLTAVPPDRLDILNGRTLTEFISLFGTLALGEALAPPYTQRLLIGKDPRTTARGTMLSGLFSIPFFLITGAIGLAALALGVTTDAAEAMPALIHAVLPVGIRGIVMAAMVSIMLSASDSFLNSASVSLVCDTIIPTRPLTARGELRALRCTNVLTGVTAILAAFLLPDVFSILTLAYSFWCPVVLVPLAAAFLGVRAGKTAFWCGALGGLAVTVVWRACGNPWGIGADMAGLLANLVLFTLCARWCVPRVTGYLSVRTHTEETR